MELNFYQEINQNWIILSTVTPVSDIQFFFRGILTAKSKDIKKCFEETEKQ